MWPQGGYFQAHTSCGLLCLPWGDCRGTSKNSVGIFFHGCHSRLLWAKPTVRGGCSRMTPSLQWAGVHWTPWQSDACMPTLKVHKTQAFQAIHEPGSWANEPQDYKESPGDPAAPHFCSGFLSKQEDVHKGQGEAVKKMRLPLPRRSSACTFWSLMMLFSQPFLISATLDSQANIRIFRSNRNVDVVGSLTSKQVVLLYIFFNLESRQCLPLPYSV